MKTLVAILFAAIATGQSFEVAAIKLHEGPGPGWVGVRIQGTTVTTSMVSLRGLIAYAHNVRTVDGGEKWTDEERYDITARAAGETAPTREQVGAMMLGLLKERFRLAEKRISKEMPVYAITVSKKGHHLKAAEKPDASGSMTAVGPGREFVLTYRSAPAAMLASSFRFPFDRPLVDKTGLTGKYDFEMKLMSGTDGTITGMDGESVFTVFEEQLGLKLEPQKAVFDAVIIEHAERPSQN